MIGVEHDRKRMVPARSDPITKNGTETLFTQLRRGRRNAARPKGKMAVLMQMTSGHWESWTIPLFQVGEAGAIDYLLHAFVADITRMKVLAI